MGDAPVLSHCSLLRNTWPKPAGVLKHYREGKTKCSFSIFSGRFLLTTSVRWRRMSVNVHFFIHSSNSCKLYGEFRELFKTTVYHRDYKICVLNAIWGAARLPRPPPVGCALTLQRKLIPTFGLAVSKEVFYLCWNSNPIPSLPSP